MAKKCSFDCIILGGGIAGLWTLSRLKQLGYSVALFEMHQLGGKQTICSQGIIHGGIKYALKGFLNQASNAIQDMPNRWQACLQGQGEINLSSAKILSSSQLLWSSGNLGSHLTTFFASKALSSRVKKLKKTQYPPLFANEQFKGALYQLNEIVLDIPSIVRALAKPYLDCIFKLPANTEIFNNALHIETEEGILECEAQQIIFAAGEGNQALMEKLQEGQFHNRQTMGSQKDQNSKSHDVQKAFDKITTARSMQTRPLHMVWVKFPESKNNPSLQQTLSLFAHCMEHGANPRITITTHLSNNQVVWYLGGQIAEEGVNRTPEQQMAFAQQELQSLFSWYDFKNVNIEIGSFFINRAEPQEPTGKRPDSYFVQALQGGVYSVNEETLGVKENIRSVKSVIQGILAWPTKLALTPLMVDEIVKLVQETVKKNMEPKNIDLLVHFLPPAFATPPWEAKF